MCKDYITLQKIDNGWIIERNKYAMVDSGRISETKVALTDVSTIEILAEMIVDSGKKINQTDGVGGDKEKSNTNRS